MFGTQRIPVGKVKTSLQRVANEYDIRLGLLFGSTVRSESTPISDVDVAILFERESGDYVSIALKIADEPQKEIHKEVDVVPLNTAPPALKYLVASEGELLYEKDEWYLRFYSQALREYFDFLYYLRQHTKRARRYLGVE